MINNIVSKQRADRLESEKSKSKRQGNIKKNGRR